MNEHTEPISPVSHDSATTRADALFEHAPDAMFVTDRAGILRVQNGRARRLLGATGVALASRVVADDRAKVEAALAGVFVGADVSIEIGVAGEGGAVVPLTVRAAAVGDDVVWTARRVDGRTARILRDRSELLEREQQLHRRAARAAAMRDRLLAAIATELRASFNSAIGWVELLRREYLDRSARDQALAHVEAHAREQVAVLDQVLDVTQVGADTAVEIAVFDLGRVMTDAIAERSERFAAKRLAVAASLVEAPVFGDRARTTKLVAFLLDAVVATAASGSTLDASIGVVHETAKASLTIALGASAVESALELPRLTRLVIEMHDGEVATTEGRLRGLTITFPLAT